MFTEFLKLLVSVIRRIWTWPDGSEREITIKDQPYTVVTPQFVSTGNFATWYAQADTMDKALFGGWFRKNNYLNLVAAMCMVESSGGLNISRQVSATDTSYGVMQVTPYTAGDIYRWGGNAFGKPTVEKLKNMPTSLYFGMAYVKILHDRFGMKTYEDISRAYNGGPGWKNASATSKANTLNHWNKIQAVLNQNAIA